jgi:hypothetical protein
MPILPIAPSSPSRCIAPVSAQLSIDYVGSVANAAIAEDARRFATPAGSSRLSKFEPCLPEGLLLDLLAERAVDLRAAREVASRQLSRIDS